MIYNEYPYSSIDDELFDLYDDLSDEEIDEYHRPKKSNSRKSLAPLFVYLILKENTNSKKHMTQQEILDELEKYPYEISIERKALSRVIHNLTDSQLGIMSRPKYGTWYNGEGNYDDYLHVA